MQNRMFDVIKSYVNKLKKTGFAHIFTSSVINKIVSLLTGIVLVRILTKEDYGVYSYANNIIGFFLLATGFGANSGVLQLGSEATSREERISIYRFGCRLGLRFNLLMALVIMMVALFVHLPIEGSNTCLALMCCWPLVQLYPELQRTFLRTELRNKEYAISNTVSVVLTFVLGSIMSFFFMSKGLILAHYVAAITTASLVCRIYHIPLSCGKVNISKDKRKTFLSISCISMLNNGISQLMYLLDVLILGFVVADSSVIASYKIATIIPTALLFIPSSVTVYIYPYFARNHDKKAWVQLNYRKVIFALGLFNVLLALILIVLAPWIIYLIFGAEYLDAVSVFKVLCVSYIFSGTFRIMAGNILVTQRKLKFNLFESIASGVLNITLNFIMIPKWHSMGAAIATLITVIFSSITSTLYLRYILRKENRNEEMRV